MTPSDHPTRDQLEAFVHGKLGAAELETVEHHVAQCNSCCDVLRTIPHDDFAQQLRAHATTTDRQFDHSVEVDPSLSFSLLASSEPNTASIPKMLLDHPRYEIVKQLGAGGMGVVYQAQHRLMGRTVALKVIRASLLKNSAAVDRFRQEVKAAAKLTHRNIVAAYDAEQAGDVHFLVMEYVPGTDLAAIVKNRGRLPIVHACNYAMQVAHGLQHAHEIGMVHRDIKPQNLVVTPKGVVKILDFGLARLAVQEDQCDHTALTREGTTLGTPDYVAPEQARDARRADIRADIYSLGCTLYYLLTGTLPFPTGTPMEKVIAHCERTPTPITQLRDDLPAELVQVVDRMMAKQPAERYQTPREVVEALKPFAFPHPDAPTRAGIETTRVEMPAITSQPTTTLHGTTTRTEMAVAPLQEVVIPAPPSKRPDEIDRRLRQPRQIVLLSIAGVIAGLIILLLGIYSFLSNGDGLSDVATTVGGDWVEVLPQINTTSDVVAGEWRMSGNELEVQASEWARISLPPPPGPEYDVELEFTRRSGVHSIALIFSAGTGQATFELDAWGEHLAGIQVVNGQDLRLNSASASIPPLENGRRYVLMLLVRRDRVEGFLDGQRVATYRGDGSDLSPLDAWRISDSQRLGLGSYLSAATFHRVRVRTP